MSSNIDDMPLKYGSGFSSFNTSRTGGGVELITAVTGILRFLSLVIKITALVFIILIYIDNKKIKEIINDGVNEQSNNENNVPV